MKKQKLKKQIDALCSEVSNLGSEVSNLRSEVSNLRRQFQELNNLTIGIEEWVGELCDAMDVLLETLPVKHHNRVSEAEWTRVDFDPSVSLNVGDYLIVMQRNLRVVARVSEPTSDIPGYWCGVHYPEGGGHNHKPFTEREYQTAVTWIREENIEGRMVKR